MGSPAGELTRWRFPQRERGPIRQPAEKIERSADASRDSHIPFSSSPPENEEPPTKTVGQPPAQRGGRVAGACQRESGREALLK